MSMKSMDTLSQSEGSSLFARGLPYLKAYIALIVFSKFIKKKKTECVKAPSSP